jgi:hypothetical protein
MVGFLGYGCSLVLFVLALRHIGTTRTGAYFSLAPFVGALVSMLRLREPVGALFYPAALLMAIGVWLHASERHEHEHSHRRLVHSHRHVHDEHHRHDHPPEVDPAELHTHEHEHLSLTHSHPYFADIPQSREHVG